MHRSIPAMADPIARLRNLGIISTLLSVPLGCGSSTPTASGTVDVLITARTVGDELDPDGYQILIDGNAVGTLAIDGELELTDLSTEGHQFAIEGIAPNCRLTNVTPTGILDPRLGSTLDLVILCLQDDPGRIIYSTAQIDFTSDGQTIRTRNALGGDLQDLTLLGNGPSVTQDGQRVAYEFNDDVWVADIDGSNAVNISKTTGVTEGHPNWSPDGTRIVYDARVPGQTGFDVYVMNEDGSEATNLTPGNPDFNDTHPSWSPDGNRIVFAKTPSDASLILGDLYTMASNGSDMVRLTMDDSPVSAPKYSPDGQQIVFARFLDLTGWELFSINSDGAGRMQLTDDGGFTTTDAAWSPDGTWMVFQSVAFVSTVPPEVYVMRSDGTDIVQLTFLEGGRLPRWLP
jgi:Tol biopolymer transport system component